MQDADRSDNNNIRNAARNSSQDAPSRDGPSGGRHTSLHISGGSVVKLLRFNLRDLSRVANESAGVMRSKWLTSSQSVVSEVSLLMLLGSRLILFLDSIIVVHIHHAPIASGRAVRKLALALRLWKPPGPQESTQSGMHCRRLRLRSRVCSCVAAEKYLYARDKTVLRLKIRGGWLYVGKSVILFSSRLMSLKSATLGRATRSANRPPLLMLNPRSVKNPARDVSATRNMYMICKF